MHEAREIEISKEVMRPLKHMQAAMSVDNLRSGPRDFLWLAIFKDLPCHICHAKPVSSGFRNSGHVEFATPCSACIITWRGPVWSLVWHVPAVHLFVILRFLPLECGSNMNQLDWFPAVYHRIIVYHSVSIFHHEETNLIRSKQHGAALPCALRTLTEFWDWTKVKQRSTRHMKIACVAFVRFVQRLYSLVWPTATKSSLLQNLDEFRKTTQKSRPHGKSCPYLGRRIEWFRRRGEWMLVILCRFCMILVRCECTSPICCWDLMRFNTRALTTFVDELCSHKN